MPNVASQLSIEAKATIVAGATDYRPLAETLIATGLRISEALALTWDDVDVASRTIRVLRSRTAEGRGSTKATASVRSTSVRGLSG